jgi:uncharacterized LabA/DUF88 family protein
MPEALASVKPEELGRVGAYVDGFNCYHGIAEDPLLRQYRWLDYRRLAEVLLPEGVQIVGVSWFTSYWHAEGSPGWQRHRDYWDALEARGVRPILGGYKRRDVRCRKCSATYPIRVEKRSDLNMGLACMCDALKDRIDTAVLVSGDGDMLALVDALRRETPNVKTALVSPPHRPNTELKRRCHWFRSIKARHLARSQLPDPVVTTAGRHICCPLGWKPPSGP